NREHFDIRNKWAAAISELRHRRGHRNGWLMQRHNADVFTGCKLLAAAGSLDSLLHNSLSALLNHIAEHATRHWPPIGSHIKLPGGPNVGKSWNDNDSRQSPKPRNADLHRVRLRSRNSSAQVISFSHIAIRSMAG